MDNVKAACSACGAELSLTHQGPYPACGKDGRTLEVRVHDTVGVKDSLSLESRREFYKKNPVVILVVIAITLASSLLGLVLTGWPGIAIGLVLGSLSYYIGPFAVIKVREINRTNVQ
jgi:hypothetical protein